MTNEKLKEHYDFLKKSYNDFLQPERDYKNGKNAKIRKVGYDDLNIILIRVDSYVTQYYDLYEFITGKTASDSQKNINWEEFISVQYFSRDMFDILKKIEEILNK